MDNIEKAILLKQELDQLRPLDKEQEERIMQKFRLDWNYHSNNLEGNSLSYGETRAFILFGLTAKEKPFQDHLEIRGHNEALLWIEAVVKYGYPLTEVFIRELHELLLKEPHRKNAQTENGQMVTRLIEIGKYKTTPNHVKTASGAMFYFATPEETPAKMEELIAWYRSEEEKPDMNPIPLAIEFHYRFIRIHPFDDGNGRTARILMNFILMKHGYPPVIIKTEDKENYYIALQQADAGDITPFISYVTINLIRSLEIMIAGAKGENIEEEDDIFKEIAVLKNRIDSLGKEPLIRKSADLIYDVYDHSFMPLATNLLAALQKLKEYYFDFTYKIYIDSTALLDIDTLPNLLVKSRESIQPTTGSFKMEWIYHQFNREGFGEFSHTGEVHILLGNSTFSVSEISGSTFVHLFTHYYKEQVLPAEINTVIRTELGRHHKLIDTKIKEVQEKDSAEA